MTLVTPILSNINTINPKKIQKILFSYSGGQIERKRLVVTNMDGVIVFDNIQNGMQLSYELQADSLNTGQFLAQVQVFDYDGNSSELSSPVLFYCYSAPLFKFEGLSTVAKNKINSPSITVKVLYSQSEGETLHSLVYYLYDEYHSLLSSSDTLYSLSEHTFYGLDNLGTYYVRAVGTTTHGIKVDTEYVGLSVQYVAISNNVLLNLTNDRWNGYVTIDCNIVDVQYDTAGSYRIENGTLTIDNNSSVTYHLDGDPADDYSIIIKAKKLLTNTPFLTLAFVNGDTADFIIENFEDEWNCKMKVRTSIGDIVQYCRLPSIATVDTEGHLIVDENGNYFQSGSYRSDVFTVFEFKRKNNLYGISTYYENDTLIET